MDDLIRRKDVIEAINEASQEAWNEDHKIDLNAIRLLNKVEAIPAVKEKE